MGTLVPQTGIICPRRSNTQLLSYMQDQHLALPRSLRQPLRWHLESCSNAVGGLQVGANLQWSYKVLPVAVVKIRQSLADRVDPFGSGRRSTWSSQLLAPVKPFKRLIKFGDTSVLGVVLKNAVLCLLLLWGSAVSQAPSSFPSAVSLESASSAFVSSFNLYCTVHVLPPSLPLSLASLALSCPVIVCSGQFIFTSLSIPPLLLCLFLSAHLWPLHPFFYPSLTFQASLPLTAMSDPCENQSFSPNHNLSLSFPSFLSAWGFGEKSHFQTGQKAGERERY